MAYFHRLRVMATARGATPAGTRRAVAPLEHDEIRFAPLPTAGVASPLQARFGAGDELPVVAAGRPADAERATAPERHMAQELGAARVADDAPTVQPLEAVAMSHRSRPASRLPAMGEPGPGAPPPSTTAEPAEAAGHRAVEPVAAPARPPVVPVSAEDDAPQAAPPAPPPTDQRPRTGDGRPAVAQAQPPRPRRDPVDRVHESLAEVRRWMAEPGAELGDGAPSASASASAGADAVAGEPAPTRPAHASSAQPPAVVESRTEVSIGTIQVTVEEQPAAAPARPARRAATGRQGGRDAVPRDYLRGW